MIRRVLFFAAALATGPFVQAHPLHAAYAEADFRPASGELEIALRLFTDDAETALSARAGRKIVVGSAASAELDAQLFALIRAAFVVKSNHGAIQPLVWRGRELKDGDRHLWIFLTCPLPGGPGGALFSNRVLRDTFSDQLNSVLVRDHATSPMRQVTLLFVTDREQRVKFP